MAVTKVGLVYYADDPEKKVFRRVYPVTDDAELDDKLSIHEWKTVGTNPRRKAVFEVVDAGSVEDRAFSGAP